MGSGRKGPADAGRGAQGGDPMSISNYNEDVLVCPQCLGSLSFSAAEVTCVLCCARYPVKATGTLDLRLRERKKVDVTIVIGGGDGPPRPEFGVMAARAEPEVRFDPSELPAHLPPVVASHIPRAPGPGSLCLDVGCGAGDYKRPLEKAGYRWVGFDYRHPRAPLWADAHALPFAENSFDFVISLAVLEHIQHPGVMLREVRRVLKPGGVYLGSVTYLVPFHDSASYFNMTHHGVWSALADAGLVAEFVRADPVYLGIRAIAHAGLFSGLRRSVAYAIVEPVVWLHRLYWAYKRGRGSTTHRSDWQMLLNTGAFVYKAVKPMA